MLIDLLAIASRLVHKGKNMGNSGFEGQTNSWETCPNFASCTLLLV